MTYRQIKLTVSDGDPNEEILHLDLDNGVSTNLSWWDGVRLYFLLGQVFQTAGSSDIELISEQQIQ